MTIQPSERSRLIRNIATTSLDALYPHRCGCCNRVCRPVPGLPGICRSCLPKIPFRTRSQALLRWSDLDGADLSDRTPVICATWYQDPIRQILLRLKFSDSPELAETLAGILLQSWNRLGLDCRAVLAVPLHKTRERERGYNQAGLIAADFARKIDRPDWSHCLIRSRATDRQSSQSGRETRRANLADAFCLSVDGLPETGDSCESRPVLLIDDVLTTGTTLVEAAAPLRRQGISVAGCVVSSEKQARKSFCAGIIS